MTDKEKATRKPVAGIMCPECARFGRYSDKGIINRATIDSSWSAPLGIDPRMYKFACPHGCVFYKVIGEKQEQNLATFV